MYQQRNSVHVQRNRHIASLDQLIFTATFSPCDRSLLIFLLHFVSLRTRFDTNSQKKTFQYQFRYISQLPSHERKNCPVICDVSVVVLRIRSSDYQFISVVKCVMRSSERCQLATNRTCDGSMTASNFMLPFFFVFQTTKYIIINYSFMIQ